MQRASISYRATTQLSASWLRPSSPRRCASGDGADRPSSPPHTDRLTAPGLWTVISGIYDSLSGGKGVLSNFLPATYQRLPSYQRLLTYLTFAPSFFARYAACLKCFRDVLQSPANVNASQHKILDVLQFRQHASSN